MIYSVPLCSRGKARLRDWRSLRQLSSASHSLWCLMCNSCINSPVSFSALKDDLLSSACLVHQQMPSWPQNIKVPFQVPDFTWVTGGRRTVHCTLQHHTAQPLTHMILYFLSPMPFHILQQIELALQSVFTISPFITIPLSLFFTQLKYNPLLGNFTFPQKAKAWSNWPLQSHCCGLNACVPPKFTCWSLYPHCDGIWR